MNFKFLPLLAIALSGFLYAEPSDNLEDFIATLKKESVYQDVIINDKIVVRGWGPNCESRYRALKQLLDQYNRPITVLDIGANLGYFSLKIAKDYDSTCVMCDFNHHLIDVCRYNTDRDNLILFQKAINAEELKRLSECEHFDVVLAFHVLHHMPEWESCLESMLALGDNIIIETPPTNDAVLNAKPTVPEIDKKLSSMEGTIILASTQRYTEDTFSNMYWIHHGKTRLTRPSWFSSKFSPNSNKFCFVDSSFDKKQFVKHFEEGIVERRWIKGINAETFLGLGAAFPEEDTFSQIKKDCEALSREELPYSKMVIQGNKAKNINELPWILSKKP